MIEQQQDVFAEMAAKYRVSQEVHPLDYIFQFLFDNESFSSKDDAVRCYFDDGAQSAQKLATLIADVCQIVDRRFTLLDFASGYGRVTRHLYNTLDQAAVTAADIHPAAVEFVERTLGVTSIGSSMVPEEFQPPASYDVVFALSFFSSMPKKTWRRWLDVLTDKASVGGHLIFTTQGLLSRRYFEDAELDGDGFWFAPLSEQKDLNSEECGQSIVHPRYAMDQVFDRADRELVHFRQGAWWEHQDLYVVRRMA